MSVPPVRRGLVRDPAWLLMKNCTLVNGHVCNICQKDFITKWELLKHERVHSGERPYVCNICQKGFSVKAYLVEHERVYSGERPFICNVCEKSFVLKRSLVKPKRLHDSPRNYGVRKALRRKSTWCIVKEFVLAKDPMSAKLRLRFKSAV